MVCDCKLLVTKSASGVDLSLKNTASTQEPTKSPHRYDQLSHHDTLADAFLELSRYPAYHNQNHWELR